MDEQQFISLMLQSRQISSNDYRIGYQRGLRRLYHGEKFGTDDEHTRYLGLGQNGDDHRLEIGNGYRDGFAGKPPALAE